MGSLSLGCCLFMVLGALAYTVTSHGTPAEPCVKQTGACSCDTATGVIDLSPLDHAKVDGTPKYVILSCLIFL